MILDLWVRVVALLGGGFLLLLGLFRAYWEVKSWEVLVLAQQRAPDVRGEYRVHVRVYLLVAALGLTVVLLGCLL